MNWVESIQKSIDYVELNLLEDITIENVAKQANTSTFHFQRTFAILTGQSVGEYVRRRRLTLAAQDLCRTNCKIIDLAFKYRYDTPEAFTKAFRRQHGISPSEARKYGGKLTFYERLIIQVILKGADPMKWNVVEKGSFHVMGVKREFSYEHGENSIGIPKFWAEVNANGTSETLSKLNNGSIRGLLGVCAANESNPKQVMDYWVAVDFDGEVPEGMECLTIPASKWVVFEVICPMPGAIQDVWNKIYSEWFPGSGYTHANAPEFELYPEGNPSSPDYYSEIWIPVK